MAGCDSIGSRSLGSGGSAGAEVTLGRVSTADNVRGVHNVYGTVRNIIPDASHGQSNHDVSNKNMNIDRINDCTTPKKGTAISYPINQT